MKRSFPTLAAVMASCFMQCGSPSKDSETKTDSTTVVTTVQPEVTKPAEPAPDLTQMDKLPKFLEDLLVYKSDEQLAKDFGSGNVQRILNENGIPYVHLFKGTKREVVFIVCGELGLCRPRAEAPAEWSMKNGVRIGMTLEELNAADGSLVEFDLTYFSTVLTNKLKAVCEVWVAAPADLKLKPGAKRDKLTSKDLQPGEAARVSVSKIMVYETDSEGDI